MSIKNIHCNIKCLVKSINIYFYLATIHLSCGYRSPEREIIFFEQCSSVHVFSIREIGSDVVLTTRSLKRAWGIHSLLNVRSICEHEHRGGLPVHAPASLQGSDWPLRVPAGRSSSESRECSPVVRWLEEWFLFWDLLCSRAMLDLAFFNLTLAANIKHHLSVTYNDAYYRQHREDH